MTTSPDVYTTTRLSWQAIGEHIMSAARHAATGRIGLRRGPGGIATPPFPADGTERRLILRGNELVVDDGGTQRAAPVTTLRAAGELVGIEPGAPTEVYTPTTPLDLDADLPIDADAASRLAAFYAVLDDALAQLRGAHADDDPAETQLWPEHFDLATTVTEINIGGSPGDAEHPEPYLYVGPWKPRSGDFWNEPWGASQPFTDATTPAAALAFFEDGLRRAGADPIA